MKVNLFFTLWICSFVIFSYNHCKISAETTIIDEHNATIEITIPVANDVLFRDSIKVSSNKETISLSKGYDTDLEKSDRLIENNYTASFQAKAQDIGEIEGSQLIVSYATKNNGAVEEKVPLTFSFGFESAIDNDQITNSLAGQEEVLDVPLAPRALTFSEKISMLVLNSDSLFIKLILVLLLGLLMSLTPCIYPMIPITAGILQSQASKSLLRNFLLALSYTVGIASTFAFLGLLAAYTGQVFGSLFAHPLFVLSVVALLVYLAFAMMGFYEMYIPKMFQPKHQNVQQGSLVSAFIFGAASGTFASPCLSPGLVMLLSIVSSLKNVILGFSLLFTFGVGLSIPLLLIGTFSSSLNLLPRAGMWMIEVKKIFGIIMLFMSLYFLAYILPINIIYGLSATLFVACALWYLLSVSKKQSLKTNIYKSSIAAVSIAASALLVNNAYQTTVCPIEIVDGVVWQHEYTCALEQAQKEHKQILVDVGAPFCSICKAIDKKLFTHPSVTQALKNYVLVKMDGSQSQNQQFTQQYHVLGFPTVLLIDPATGKEVKRWGAELYGKRPEQFINDLKI